MCTVKVLSIYECRCTRQILSSMYHQSQTYGRPPPGGYTEPNVLDHTRRPGPEFLNRAALVPDIPFQDGPFGPNGIYRNMRSTPQQSASSHHGVMPEINWSNRLQSDHMMMDPVSTNPMHDEIRQMQRTNVITHHEFTTLLDESAYNKVARNDLLSQLRRENKISQTQWERMYNYSSVFP